MPADLPEGIELREPDRPGLCPAYSTSMMVHCAVPVPEGETEHAGAHWGLGFSAPGVPAPPEGQP